MAKKTIKRNYPCGRCGGTGWYSQPANLGCVYCGGMNKGKEGVDRRGSGIHKYNEFMKEVFSDWTLPGDAMDKIAKKMRCNEAEKVELKYYLNRLYYNDYLILEDGKLIDADKKPKKKRVYKKKQQQAEIDKAKTGVYNGSDEIDEAKTGIYHE